MNSLLHTHGQKQLVLMKFLQEPINKSFFEGMLSKDGVRLNNSLTWIMDIFLLGFSLVTQPMMQRRLNPTELRSMDSYIQIFYRFQKSKRKIPPRSPLSDEKSPFTPPKEDCFHPV